MKLQIKKYIKETIYFVLFITIFANIVSFYKSQDLNKDSLHISSFKTLNNQKYIIDDSQPTLIYFWATWCPVCKLNSPNIEQLSKHFNIVTIAVKSGNDKDIQEYLKENNLNFEVVNDEYGYMSEKFSISVFPTILIYDKNKGLKFSDVGYSSTFMLYVKMWFSSL